MPRIIVLTVCAVLCAVATPAVAQQSPPSTPTDRVVIDGLGSAHGLGMAMDGVEGEARAGWSHERILSLFYPGTSTARAYGTIRVWLDDAGTERVSLPSGGSIAGLRLLPGSIVTAAPAPKGQLAIVVSTPSPPKTAAKPRATAKPATKPAPTSTPRPARSPRPSPTPAPTVEPPFRRSSAAVLPTAPPLPAPTPGGPHHAPRPTPGASGSPLAANAAIFSSPVTITPAGAPALTLVGATGNRYRGTIELRRTASGVRVINHVALEDYVSGIAEERGAGWPLEAMETLAIAARTLGSATMTWMDANHADGYDICPNDHCQVYMGYDGEEAVMREAAQATAGEIRAYGGRPIVAMYHGNGGGQTASYRELTDDGSDPYPYLQSIKYPYADPWHWQVTTTLHEMAAALTSAGNQVPAPLKYVVVVKRGESPRVKLVGLFSNARNGVGISGVAFSRALQLPSTWFYVHLPHRPPHSIEEGVLGLTESGRGGNPAVPSPRFPWSLALLAGALAAAAAAANLGVNGGAATVASAFSTLRPRIARTLTRRPSTADASISG